MELSEYNEMTEERRQLARERIREIALESFLSGAAGDYFNRTARFLTFLHDTEQKLSSGEFGQMTAEELSIYNRKLYEEILPESYESSYTNPVFAVSKFGKKTGQYLSFLCSEIMAAIPRIFEGRLFDLTIVSELFIEIYNHFEDAFEQDEVISDILVGNISESVYYYAHDYSEIFAELKLLEMLGENSRFAYDIIMNSDLAGTAYLYRYGEFITENEIRISAYLNRLPESEVKAMANTFTEGYIRGFQTMGVDFSKKSQILIRFPIGFERMLRYAIRTFEGLGKRVNLYRAPADTFNKTGGRKNGYMATPVNPQYDYDHRYDFGLYYDNRMKEHRLDCQKNAWEKFVREAAEYAGPAQIRTFGEPDFMPVNKTEAVMLSSQQEKLYTDYQRDTAKMVSEYIPNEETSYTIIAYPLPSIGEDFEAIFDETIRINNLDNEEYRQIQQNMIDVLDRGEYVKILGAGDNRTDMKVYLIDIEHPEKQTKFENCTADVNIPVGEVFTSPKLSGTEGLLHVSSVFLNGLEYRGLTLRFLDGKVTEYSCSNFDSEEEGKRFIKENILMNHDSLPMGEFAIGTNTTAYRMGRKYNIQAKLPILIAEKTGPHFAVGDTCYKRSEDHAVFNPNGKEIMARDNEVSILRKTDDGNAYFNCHTDITIPYNEIKAITVCGKDGKETDILRDGKFVLPGTEKLNEALEDGAGQAV